MNEMQLRTTRLDVIGRSLVLNILAIVLNLAAVFFIAKGFHSSTGENAFMMKMSGFAMLTVTLLSLVVFKGMFLFSYVARALVGGLFIVSGLIKANDPWGFAFKLEEYFEPTGLAYDFPFFESFAPYALKISIFICIVEIVIGAAIVLGGKIKLASCALILMMFFFTWLTWYTYSCNLTQSLGLLGEGEVARQCVTDCGCFGDALRGSVGRSLTPLESFWKDLVLLYLAIIIFVNQWKIKLNSIRENWIMVPASILVIIFFSWVFGWMLPIFFAIIAFLGAFVLAKFNIGKMGKEWKMAIFVTILSGVFSFYTSSYLPIKDYRPYAVGNNLVEQMNNGVPQQSDFFYFYENLATGQVDTVAVSDWTADYGDTTRYKYVSYEEQIIREGSASSIQDLSALVNYNDLSTREKSIAFVDSVYQSDYESYYEEKLMLRSEYGIDTIPFTDFDTIYYPDSIYTKAGNFTGLVDENSPFSMDLTNYLVTAPNIFLMTIRDVKEINESSIPDFQNVLKGARENNIPFFILSAAGQDEMNAFKEEYGIDATVLGCDGIEVKIIIRSNPGLVLLQNGTVMDKWPSRSIAQFDDIYTEYFNIKKD